MNLKNSKFASMTRLTQPSTEALLPGNEGNGPLAVGQRGAISTTERTRTTKCRMGGSAQRRLPGAWAVAGSNGGTTAYLWVGDSPAEVSGRCGVAACSVCLSVCFRSRVVVVVRLIYVVPWASSVPFCIFCLLYATAHRYGRTYTRIMTVGADSLAKMAFLGQQRTKHIKLVPTKPPLV